MSEWKSVATANDLDRALATHIANRLEQDITVHGCASLAVSGGSTPKEMFRLLSCARLDWSKVWVTLVDERWVDPSSDDSNERLVRENLLRENASSAHFVSLKSEHPDARQAVTEISENLAAVPAPFSMLVLGMGGDGHTASWFPGASNLDALLDRDNPDRVAASDPPEAPHQRMTLTLAAVMDSRDIAVHITGEKKKTVLTNATARGYPIAAVVDQQKTPVTIWWAP